MTDLKRKSSVLFTCAIITMVVSGCGIGYNKTLFFTKTNVGVDFDSQPPTAEITIARREGVIAPTFEGGQTPPILASFHLEVKGFAALFAGISTTFVGGDSAVAFAKLYDDDYTPCLQTRQEANEYDSSLELSELPGQSDPHRDKRLYEAGDVEPFLFGTDTSFGLKVAWSGMTAQVPDTVRLGFNRKEFALAPVTVVPGNNGDKPYKVKMPSFLATIDNSTRLKAVSDGGVSHLQYFATGKAADKLSLRYAVRKAMAKRLDPDEAKEFGISLRGESRGVAIAVLSLIKGGLEELQGEDTLSPEIHTQAKLHVDKLNLLVSHLPETYPFTRYTHPGGSGKDYHAVRNKKKGEDINRGGFDEVVVYLTDIDESMKMYTAMLAVDGLTVDGEQPVDLKKEILRHLDSAKKAREKMKAIERDPALIDAVEFYFNVIFGR